MFKPHVTVACVVHAAGKFLVVEETINGKALWNQPAGHLEADETLVQAAERELWEETGIETERAELLEVVEHRFSDRIVTLNFYLVEAWAGEPFGREGQPMRWVKQVDLREDEFPEANVGIIQLLVAQANAAQ
ncbi:NUDIX domain-containing protein [Serratia marcescens]|uniref:NUDIX domain-containing protein n=1 Tax=Serratia marcescens TaxID=615 RepID=UPI000F7E378C|nr:NUDIX domain-containing protein [Serratia marcescens]RTF97301.1 NUDIX domain-containing protein [Serratia marcescens]